MGKFVFDNLEMIVASGCLLSTGLYLILSSKKRVGYTNDITPFIVAHKKQQETIARRSKSIFGR